MAIAGLLGAVGWSPSVRRVRELARPCKIPRERPRRFIECSTSPELAEIRLAPELVGELNDNLLNLGEIRRHGRGNPETWARAACARLWADAIRGRNARAAAPGNALNPHPAAVKRQK